jgi:hypothetical protein
VGTLGQGERLKGGAATADVLSVVAVVVIVVVIVVAGAVRLPTRLAGPAGLGLRRATG